MRELGAVIRNQIPCLRPAILEAYGDILHRAWREASGACALEAEHLIQASLRLSRGQGSPCWEARRTVSEPRMA